MFFRKESRGSFLPWSSFSLHSSPIRSRQSSVPIDWCCVGERQLHGRILPRRESTFSDGPKLTKTSQFRPFSVDFKSCRCRHATSVLGDVIDGVPKPTNVRHSGRASRPRDISSDRHAVREFCFQDCVQADIHSPVWTTPGINSSLERLVWFWFGER